MISEPPISQFWGQKSLPLVGRKYARSERSGWWEYTGAEILKEWIIRNQLFFHYYKFSHTKIQKEKKREKRNGVKHTRFPLTLHLKKGQFYDMSHMFKSFYMLCTWMKHLILHLSSIFFQHNSYVCHVFSWGLIPTNKITQFLKYNWRSE